MSNKLFFKAKLIEKDIICLNMSRPIYDSLNIDLVVDKTVKIPLKPFFHQSLLYGKTIKFKMDKPLELGHNYEVEIDPYEKIPLIVNDATTFPGFDEEYFYDGDDLGANYHKTFTEFVVWAPLASSVLLKIKPVKKNTVEYHELTREEHGVYRLKLKGNYELAEYVYLVTNNECTEITRDIYAKGSSVNGASSIVINPKNVKQNVTIEKNSNKDKTIIIYESNVRDLTSDKSTNIVNKGKCLGLAEKGKTIKNTSIKVGLDYLKELGITHLQLQPLNDFARVDELNPSSSYNWGYDPEQLFVVDGSFITDPSNAYLRITELQKMINALHKNNIKVVIDVVFNHSYESFTSSYYKTVPNYYFRINKDSGTLENGSWCGNEVASERPMTRKLLVDVVKYWINVFDIDGLRFDLMGLIDMETLREINATAKHYKKDFLLYGEGWDMSSVRDLEFGCLKNADELAGFSFFNDKYREVAKRFYAGDASLDEFAYVYLGSSFYYSRPPMFLSPRKSINYIECHDNATYFDFLSKNYPYLSEEDKVKIYKFALAGTLFAFGIPFIHAGQEVGQSKDGYENTYNMPDKFNRLNYQLTAKNQTTLNYIKDAISLRKTLKFLNTDNLDQIAKNIDFNLTNGVFTSKILDVPEIKPFKEVSIIYNPTPNDFDIHFTNDHTCIFSQDGRCEKTGIKDDTIPARTICIYALD